MTGSEWGAAFAQGWRAQAAVSHPMDRREKVRTVRSIRRQLDHALMLQSLGMPVDAVKVEHLNDQLAALARTEPALTLAEVSRG